MARTRNWSFQQRLEIVIRHEMFQQPYRHIAEHVGLNYQQVRNYLKSQPTPTIDMLANLPALQEEANRMMDQIKEDLDTGHEIAPKLSQAKEPLTPEQRAELDAEVKGCIQMAREVASQYGISPRRFLHDCITNPESAG